MQISFSLQKLFQRVALLLLFIYYSAFASCFFFIYLPTCLYFHFFCFFIVYIMNAACVHVCFEKNFMYCELFIYIEIFLLPGIWQEKCNKKKRTMRLTECLKTFFFFFISLCKSIAFFLLFGISFCVDSFNLFFVLCCRWVEKILM